MSAGFFSKSACSFKVVTLYKQLKLIYEQNNNNPVSYFEFVLDPTSFSKTIENVFHLSFLIKDKLAELRIENSLPFLVPRKESLILPSEAEDEDKTQMIMAFNEEEWEKLVKAFDVQKPQIQHNFQDLKNRAKKAKKNWDAILTGKS